MLKFPTAVSEGKLDKVLTEDGGMELWVRGKVDKLDD